MELYEIVFKGEVMPGLSMAQVKNDLASLFKTQPQQLDRLFDQQPHTLKSELPRDDAERYRAALKNAGAITYLRRAGAQRAAPAATRHQAAGLSLAPQQGYLLSEQEREQATAVAVDTSALALAPLDSGPLAPPKAPAPPPPDTDHIQLSPTSVKGT